MKSKWSEIGRWKSPRAALNALIEFKLMSFAAWYGKLEEVPSRTRSGDTSFVVSVAAREGDKPSLSVLEKQYVTELKRNTKRGRTSRRRRR